MNGPNEYPVEEWSNKYTVKECFLILKNLNCSLSMDKEQTPYQGQHVTNKERVTNKELVNFLLCICYPGMGVFSKSPIIEYC